MTTSTRISSHLRRGLPAAVLLLAGLVASRAATAYTTPGGGEHHRLACDFMPAQLSTETCTDSAGNPVALPSDNSRAWFEAQLAERLSEDDIPVWSILLREARVQETTVADIHDLFKNWVYCEILAAGQTHPDMLDYTQQVCPVQ